MATAEFSKFAGILSAALPQHHLSGFSSGKSIQAEKCPTGWEEYTEELYKKDLHDPDNHDDVITNLEPDILESEVK